MTSLLFAILVLASPPKKLLILGDSISHGYGIESHQAYPALIEKQLQSEGISIRIMNGAISGSLSSSGPGRLKWYLRDKPDILLLQLGGNDGLKGTPPEQIQANLRKTIALAKENQIQVILAGMKIFRNYGEDYSRRFERAFSETAKQEKITLIPFLLDDVGGRRDLNLADGIHPNAKGHELIAKHVLQYLRKYL